MLSLPKIDSETLASPTTSEISSSVDVISTEADSRPTRPSTCPRSATIGCEASTCASRRLDVVVVARTPTEPVESVCATVVRVDETKVSVVDVVDVLGEVVVDAD